MGAKAALCSCIDYQAETPLEVNLQLDKVRSLIANNLFLH